MALISLNKTIAAELENTSVKTVDNLVNYLLQVHSLDDVTIKHIEEFKNTLKNKSTKKVKKSRVPSSYNIYIKEKMAELKAAGNTGNLMKMAIEEWKKDK